MIRIHRPLNSSREECKTRASVRMSVIIETTEGAFTIDLLTDSCPTTCLNFLKLCKIKYYNNCLFFNVQQNFIAQTGDPTGREFPRRIMIRNRKGRIVCIRSHVVQRKWNQE